MKNILFYKYIEIKKPEKLRKEQFDLAKSLKLLGTILVAREGINGCLSGDERDLEQYKKILAENKEFSDIKFKESHAGRHTFKRLHARVRDEIVSSKFKAKIENKAQYIEPGQFKKLLDENKKDSNLILLDARNDYEVNMGKFKDSIHLNLDTFREFPTKIKELQDNNKFCNNKNNNKNFNNKIKNKNNNNKINSIKNKKNNNENQKITKNIKNSKNNKLLKNKKIILYCTGGVRCEKASAFLRENGFNDVFQLHGGILAYGSECGNAHWEGKCFVFDTRGAVDIDPSSQSEPITQCVLCNLPNAELHNCALTTCDRFFTACGDCLSVLMGCCSKGCRNSMFSLS